MKIKFLAIAIVTAFFYSACNDNGNSTAPQNDDSIESSSSNEETSLSSSSFFEENPSSSSSENISPGSSSSETKVNCYATTKESESGEIEKYIECDDGQIYLEKFFRYVHKYNYGANCTLFQTQICDDTGCHHPIMCPAKTWSD